MSSTFIHKLDDIVTYAGKEHTVIARLTPEMVSDHYNKNTNYYLLSLVGHPVPEAEINLDPELYIKSIFNDDTLDKLNKDIDSLMDKPKKDIKDVLKHLNRNKYNK